MTHRSKQNKATRRNTPCGRVHSSSVRSSTHNRLRPFASTSPLRCGAPGATSVLHFGRKLGNPCTAKLGRRRHHMHHATHKSQLAACSSQHCNRRLRRHATHNSQLAARSIAIAASAVVANQVQSKRAGGGRTCQRTTHHAEASLPAYSTARVVGRSVDGLRPDWCYRGNSRPGRAAMEGADRVCTP
jgi:hypothetical protein